MFSSTACYNATLRSISELPETSVITRIGNVLERFGVDKTVQAIGTCGVITHMTVVSDIVNKKDYTEITIDDGIDTVSLLVAHTKFEEYNLGDVVQVVVKNNILLNTSEVVLYATLNSKKIGQLTNQDLAVIN